MKKFENKKTDVTIPDMEKSSETELVTKKATYADLVLMCTRAPREEGFSVDDMRKRFRLIDALEGIKETAVVKLEDSDYELLKQVCNDFKWSNLHKDILPFIDTMNKLKTTTK